MIPIEYVTGDATDPHGEGVRVIIHIVNDRGGWGKGFVTALSKKWSGPEAVYRSDYKAGSIQLGRISDPILVAPNLFVINMVAQEGYSTHGNPAIRYSHLDQCLRLVGDLASQMNASVHAPRIGTGLAGGSWDEVELLIDRNLSLKNVRVTIYDLP